MKFRTLFLSLVMLMSFLSISYNLEAQCSDVPSPQIEIPDICMSPGEEVMVPIRVYNWTDVIYWNFSICFSNNVNFNTNLTISNVSGQQVIFNTTTGNVTLAWGGPTICPAKGLTLADGSIIAFVRVRASDVAPAGSCVSLSVCNTTVTTPPHVGQCNGETNIETIPISCGGSACIANSTIFATGSVRNRNGQGVQGLNITNSATSQTATTFSSGFYFFTNLPTTAPITITPQPLSMTPNMNGVTSFDLIPFTNHFNMTQSLDCYQMIAADANCSGTITAFDQVVIQQSILTGIPQQCVGQWVFIPADHNLACVPFQNVVPTGFPTSIAINDFCGNSTGNDFIAVKIGDLSGNATMKQGASPADLAPETANVTLTPNPFRDLATLRLELPEDETAQIRVFDLTGKLLHSTAANLVNGGATVELDATAWPSGTLIYQVVAASGSRSGRMLHMKQ